MARKEQSGSLSLKLIDGAIRANEAETLCQCSLTLAIQSRLVYGRLSSDMCLCKKGAKYNAGNFSLTRSAGERGRLIDRPYVLSVGTHLSS